MSVFLIVNASVDPTNPEAYKSYAVQSAELFKKAGAQPVHKLPLDHLLVGEELPGLVAITEWPSKASILEIFESKSYGALIPLRNKAFNRLEVFISQ